MTTLFWVSYALLWITVLFTVAAAFCLYRYLGQRELSSREGRARQGPEYASQLPGVSLVDLQGNQVTVGRSGHPQLVFFASTKCKTCTTALPALTRFSTTYARDIETVMVCWASKAQSRQFAGDRALDLRIVADAAWELGTRLRISATPFAVLIDGAGVVRAKGAPTTDEEFESFVEHFVAPAPITFEATARRKIAAAVEGDLT